MATKDNAAKARMGKLIKDADELGLSYPEDVTEEALRQAVKDEKEARKAAEKQEDPSPSIAARETGKAIGEEMAKALKAFRSEEKDNTAETYEEPSPDDRGEMKFYFVPMIYWRLPAKKIAGRLVKAPYGPIDFKHDRGSAVRVGNQWQTRYMAVHATDNKKVQAYMESHVLFGKMFFLSNNKVSITTDQVKYAQAFSRRMDSLNTVMAAGQSGLYSLATQLGVELNRDMSLNSIRTAIAEKQAQADVEDAKAELHRIMAEQSRNTLITEALTNE